MTDALLREGHLEQTCPECGRWEAAGAYCSGCWHPMTASDYYQNGDQAERTRRGAVRDDDEARQKPAGEPRTPVNGGRKPKHPHLDPDGRFAW